MNVVDHYMALEYLTMVYPLPDNEGGGWLAEIPELKGCMSDGKTREEALENLQDAKRCWLIVAIKRRQQIPLPIPVIKI